MKREMRELILIVFLLLPGSLIAQTSYYVSSSEGNDSNSGTATGQAWKSLEKVNSFKPQAGDKILFKRGDEWVGTLTPPASGSAGNPITYGAYGTGNKPKIYGSQVITGWTLHKGSIYKATVESVVSQVFVSNERIRVARYQSVGYSFPSTINSTTQFQSNDLDSGIDYTGATCVYRSYAYRLFKKQVVGSSSNTITLESAPTGGISTSKGFILVNKLEFLTQPGEWYYDDKTNTLYAWMPAGGNPANYSVRASTVDNGVYIWSRSYLKFENFEFNHHANSGFFGNNCNNIAIDNCDIKYPEFYGVRVAGGSQNTYTVTNNRVVGANGDGICVFAPNSTIENNTVSDIALLENLGIKGTDTSDGIKFIGNNTVCRYNIVNNVGYNGIHWLSPNATISYNFIDGACTVLDDGGGIYTWSSDYSATGSAGSVVDHNIVLNVIGNRVGYRTKPDFGYGIYIDQRIHDVKVTNNTIYNVSGGILLNAEHGRNLVQGNTVMNFAMGIQVEPDRDVSEVSDNIFFSANINRDYTWWLDKPQRIFRLTKSNPKINHNKYYNHYHAAELFDSNSDGYFETFSNWQTATGQDVNSTFDGSPLAAGEIEELFYNDTKQTKAISLGSSIYRDLDGKEISGSISLEPFTSQILIKTSKELAKVANSNPEILDQSFDVSQPKDVNEFIGQIIANDADAGQVLTYTIVEGNGDNLFALDALTGELVANATIQATTDQTIALTVQVTDNASTPLSASAQISIRINAVETAPAPDTTAPTIASFSIPSSYRALTIPVSEFTASDDTGVAGYQLTETATTPTTDDQNWTASAPESHTFSAEGTHTLYAWVKDAAGNISPATSSSVAVSLPDLSPTFSEYLFEEPAGETVFDTQGSNDGTLLNEEIRVEGVSGDGLQLTGQGYISLGNSFGANVQDELTLSAWIQPQSTSSTYQGIIMHGGPNVDSYALYIHPGDQSISFKTSGTTSAWTTIGNVAGLWDGNWHYLAVTYNGAQKVIYLDGEILLSVDAAGLIESGEGYNLLIGAGRDDENPTLLYEGLLDEVRIYNSALTSSQIGELFDRVKIEQNQSPLIQTQLFEITEPKAVNDFVGKVIASDPDLDQTLSYAITAGNTEGLFKINPETGEIFANSNLPASVDQTVTMLIQVTDSHQEPLAASANVTIAIQAIEVNQSPVAQNLTVEIDGNFKLNDLIGTIVGSDPDAGQLLTYTITGGNEAGLFNIKPETGEIHAAADFITTTNQTVVLMIEVKDNAAEPLAASVTATINLAGIQLNQSPVIEDQTVEIQKDIQINDFILQIVASDPDVDQKLTYAITQGNDAGLFKINPETGAIFANAPIPATANQSFALVVQATDNAENPLSAQANITIISLKIAEINSQPVAQNLTVEIAGNFEVNDLIGKIVASDPDAGQLLTYTIVGGNEEGLFHIDMETGDIHASADFITTTDQTVILTIEVRDNATEPLGTSSTATINITGIQLNQSPAVEDQIVEIQNEIQINDFILQVVASDPDVEQKLTYAIIQGNEAGLFKINPETGEVFANAAISGAIDQSFSLVVQVTDNAENPMSAHANITIISLKIVAINRQPVAQNLTVEIEGNFAVNDLIGKILASDPDAGQLLTYTITGGNQEGLFKINPETGEIHAAVDFISTTDQTVILTIEVKDNADEPLVVNATATINITGIQLNQSPMISNQAFDIDGDLTSNEFIGQLFASDPDTGQKLSYSIVQGNEAGLFKLDPETGEVFANQAISVNSNETFTFVVQVTDDHQMPLSGHANVTIQITPAFVNQSPVIGDQSFEIRKNDKLGDMIGQVLASDPNAEQSLTFDIVSGNEEGAFSIDPVTGALYATDAIQLTTSESIVLEVEVTDNAVEPLSVNAYITIAIVINGKIVDGEVKNNNPNRIILVYSEPLKTANLKSSQIFSDFVLSGGKNVQQVTINGNEIYLDLDSEYQYDDEITVSYSRGSTPIYDASGNEVEPFDSYEVTNNILMGNGVNTSIDPTANALDVIVYPNPSDGQVNIRANNLTSDDCELFLFSMTGNLVSKKLVSASFGNLEERLNLSQLNKGTYIIKLISKRQIFQEKIVIM